MYRRDFIRLVGGGILVGVAVGQVGCATVSPSVREAWLGPPKSQDSRLCWLGYAILAPNPHNIQPWLLYIPANRDELTLYVDHQRLLPATDPYSRQIVIGHGTFIELLIMAAKADGFSVEVTLFPQGEFPSNSVDDRPLAKLSFSRSGQPVNDPLFGQVLRRRSNKLPFDLERAVSAENLAAIVSAAERPGIEATGTLDTGRVARLRTRASAAWLVEQQTQGAMLESLRLTRVGAWEIEAHRDGLSVTGIVPEIASAIGLFPRDTVPAPDSLAFERMRAKVDAQANTAMGWVWLKTRGNTRRQQVEAGRAFVRMQLAATAAGIALHPMSQALQEYPEMRSQFLGLHEDLGTAPDKDTIQMLARIGYAPAVSPTPRRKLSDLVREGV
jgi:hypothetical protein